MSITGYWGKRWNGPVRTAGVVRETLDASLSELRDGVVAADTDLAGSKKP